MLDLLAIGDLMVDFTPAGKSAKDNPLFEQNPGGAPANVCATVARLGGKSGFLGTVGDEIFGRFLEKKLGEYGVDRRGLHFSDEGSTKIAYVTLDENNERSFYFVPGPLAEIHLLPEDVDPALLDDCRVFLLSTVSQYQEPIRTTSKWLVDEIHRRGALVAYDPNWNCAFSSDEEYERDIIRTTIAKVDIAKISLEEATFAYAGCSEREIADTAMRAGVKLFMITRGKRGCYYRFTGGEGEIPSYRVDVRDTTGSGDAFMGGLIYSLTRPGMPGIEDLSQREMEEILSFANACGAVCATKRGAMPSVDGVEEVLRLMRDAQRIPMENNC